jgi:hypothetical protein
MEASRRFAQNGDSALDENGLLMEATVTATAADA